MKRDEDLVITLNEKKVDLNTSFPFTFKDLKQLKKDGCDLLHMKDGGMGLDELFAIAKHACIKANSEVTEEDVEDMPITLMNKLSSAAFGGGDEDLDRPT